MTLTACIGSSGSGKTTFLNDVYNSHKCVYIRQYHKLRPYITVSQIPNFDPSLLPFWSIYVGEGKDKAIKVGGSMAGKFYAGLSGGQRKMLIFEMIYQRTIDQKDLLIVLDEPFAGVTDDFVPYIVDRLNLMRLKHNILLVTNDHIQVITTMSDNTITVSAIDRTTVSINTRGNVDRKQAILAMSIGDNYSAPKNSNDLRFFYNVEVYMNAGVIEVLGFALFFYALFIPTFWKSKPKYSEPLMIIAANLIGYLCLNPFLLALVDWRDLISEETEALLHSSAPKLKILKTLLTLVLISLISAINFGCINLVIDTLREGKYFVGIFFDAVSMTVAFIAAGLYTTLPLTQTQIIGTVPFLFLMFFSSTFSPASGVEFFNEFRFLFTRFYLWCIIPGVGQEMTKCPKDSNTLYMILAGLFNIVLFFCIKFLFEAVTFVKHYKSKKDKEKQMLTDDFVQLQGDLFGSKALKRFQHLSTMSSHLSSGSLAAKSEDNGDEKSSSIIRISSP